ncbi:hypothetical protein LBR_12395 [Levilactobacillus brevis]|uniref:hypothetical protein n=1 Tax=Levilactobacillus brevis TaxID=1580 RepID=UPI000A105ACE|nr:hypothetical protein [Levilactobacillus brevis]ORJ52904.1 hypothetical protein LBR_12395 [Levilactobacillus brevis]
MKLLRHHITLYFNEKNEAVFESWIQLNLFGRNFYFSDDKILLNPESANDLVVLERLVGNAN